VRYGSSGAGVAVNFSAGTKTIQVVEMGAPHVQRYREQTAAGPGDDDDRGLRARHQQG
jgi:hypothetical protein